MRTDYIRVYKSVHTWTGIIAGMALFIAFYAGALTVFKEPIERWVAPPRAGELVPMADAQRHIVETIKAHPAAAKQFNLNLHDTERTHSRMDWQVREAGGDDHDESRIRHFAPKVNASGRVSIEEFAPSRLGHLIDTLHRVVGLPVDSDPNRWIMGVVASLYFLALVSGVVVLLPTLVKDFFALRLGKNLKRMWLDAHNVVGIVSLPFHIVMALTAVVFAYHDGFYYVQDKLLHDGQWGKSNSRGARVANDTPRDVSNMLPPQALVKAAQEVSPGFAPYMLQYRQVTGPKAVVRVWGKDETAVSPRARGGFAAVDPYTGKVVNSEFMPGVQPTAGVVISSFFALHMASFGGTPVQWMYFLLGLAGAWLFYTGNLLWVESRRKAARKEGEVPKQRLDTRLMASATVGVCLGCVCGISLTMVAGKWLHAHVADLNAWHTGLYYAAFFLALAWSSLRGAAAASVHLLWAAALLTLLIPLTSLASWLLPGLDLWVHASAASLGVDLTALAGALCFAWMAMATQRRVQHGPRDSVWSDTGKDPGPDTVPSPVYASAEAGSAKPLIAIFVRR